MQLVYSESAQIVSEIDLKVASQFCPHFFVAKNKRKQKISYLSQGKWSDTSCEKPATINNENARYKRNNITQKEFYWSQATSRGQPPFS